MKIKIPTPIVQHRLDQRKLTLDERLAKFNPNKHSREFRPSECLGLEKCAFESRTTKC